MKRGTNRWVIAIVLLGVFLFFAFWLTIGYVAWHFIEKFW